MPLSTAASVTIDPGVAFTVTFCVVFDLAVLAASILTAILFVSSFTLMFLKPLATVRGIVLSACGLNKVAVM